MRNLAFIVIGLVIAVFGYWFQENVHLAFQETLQGQGIPLELGKTISMIGMFIALFPLLNMFYFKPLGDAIHGRTTELEATFKEAEDLKAEMGQLRTDYEKRLAETEASAREKIQAQIKEAQALRDSLRSEAVQQAEDFKKRAIDEVESEKQKLLSDLRLHVVNLTLTATEKLIGENMDSEKNRKLVEEFIEKVEAPA